MKRGIILLLIISILFATACNNSSGHVDEDKLQVYTSFYVLYDFVSKIGGDHVEAINMIPPGGDPHHWEPTASDITNLEEAHVFIYNGLSLEHWVEGVIGAIQNEDLIVVEASKGITTIEGDHNPGEMDPHIWLDPNKSKLIFENIKDALIEADPEHREVFESNYKKYVEKLDSLDLEYKEKLDVISNRDMVVSHEAFTYLSSAYNLNQVAIEGLIPDSEPSPSRMAEIIDYINDKDIGTIFFEDENDTKTVDTISSETGVNFHILYTLEYLTDEQIANGDDYFSVMRSNLESLVRGLE